MGLSVNGRGYRSLVVSQEDYFGEDEGVRGIHYHLNMYSVYFPFDSDVKKYVDLHQ